MADFNTILAATLADRMSKPMLDPAKVAAAISTPSPTNDAFGGINPGSMLGLLPEDVSNIATQRSTMAYQKMLTDLGALDFVRKATGAEASETLGNTLIAGQQKHSYDMAEIAAHGKWSTAAAASGDPIRAIAAKVVQKAMNLKPGATLSKTEQALFDKYSDAGMDEKTAAAILTSRENFMGHIASSGAKTPEEQAKAASIASILYPMGSNEQLSKAAQKRLGISVTDDSVSAKPAASTKKSEKKEVERRKTKGGKTIIKYDDGSFAYGS